MLNDRYRNSEAHLTRAEKTIPLGSQTFSKSRTLYPVGISPLYIDRAKGSYIWDIDGNRYIDLVNSLTSVTLGYGDERVNRAVKEQLDKGVSFSLPGILEAEVAELIVSMIPSAEMVRFGKNGTDATSAAVRLARAYTGRDHVVVCGYHGWQDWYIGSTTRNKGVPDSVSALTHKFSYNDLDSLKLVLESHSDQVAAVILEPMNAHWPNPGFLKGVQKLAHAAGAVLIFDETITGFRFSRGGAQELFKVTPDLSTFGKGIANGFPLSAVVGRREIMLEMEEIFFSGTFGGELLSLAAAKSVLQRHLEEDVCGSLSEIGTNLETKIMEIARSLGLSKILDFTGHPTWKFLDWKPSEEYDDAVIRTFFMQEMFARGILITGTHNISLGHSSKDVSAISDAYEDFFKLLDKSISDQNLMAQLRVAPLQPLFKVR